jgi:hypothetical protein
VRKILKDVSEEEMQNIALEFCTGSLGKLESGTFLDDFIETCARGTSFADVDAKVIFPTRIDVENSRFGAQVYAAYSLLYPTDKIII